MHATAKTLGERCVILDGRIVADHNNEAAIKELRLTAHAIQRHAGYQYFSRYYVARAAFFQQKFKKCLYFFNAAHRAAQTSPVLDSSSSQLNRDLCLIGAAIAHFNLRQRDHARSCLDQVMNPEHPKIGGRYYGEVGWNSLRDKQYRLAEEAFLNSLRFDRLNKYSMNGLGNALYELKRHAEAKNVLENSLKIDRHYSHTWCDLGYVNLALNKVNDAELQFGQAISMNQTPRAIRGLGQSYIKLGRHKDGIALVDYADFLEHGKGTGQAFAAAIELLSEVVPTK